MAKNKGDQLPPGYLAVSRRFFEHDFWKEPRVYSWAEAWLDLLQTAWYGDKPSRQMINKTIISFERGQLVASIRFLSQRWSWPHGNVQRFIDLLERENMISRHTERNQTIVTIINYEAYNGGGSNPRGYAVLEKSKKTGTPNGTPSGSPSGTHKDHDNNGVITDTGTPNGTPSGSPSGTLAVHLRYKEEESKESNKEEGDIGVGATAPGIDQEKELFEAFTAWVDKHAPSVNKMKEPFTPKQYATIRAKFPKEVVQEVILAMHNKIDLLKKYTSANLTCQDWCRRRLKDQRTGTGQPNKTADDIRAARQQTQPA